MRVRFLALSLFFLAAASLAAQQADALQLYRQGRDLEYAGKEAEAEAKYLESVKICDAELAATPTRMDAFAVKAWSLQRLKRYSEVIEVGTAGLKISSDMRLVEVMGEAYFYLNDMTSSLRYMQRYTDNSPETADRISTAYFFMAEAYFKLKKWEHADIAYTMALAKDPNTPRWWYRLGQVREFKGELKPALAAYERAIALQPSLTEAVQGRDRLREQAQ